MGYATSTENDDDDNNNSNNNNNNKIYLDYSSCVCFLLKLLFKMRVWYQYCVTDMKLELYYFQGEIS